MQEKNYLIGPIYFVVLLFIFIKKNIDEFIVILLKILNVNDVRLDQLKFW